MTGYKRQTDIPENWLAKTKQSKVSLLSQILPVLFTWSWCLWKLIFAQLHPDSFRTDSWGYPFLLFCLWQQRETSVKWRTTSCSSPHSIIETRQPIHTPHTPAHLVMAAVFVCVIRGWGLLWGHIHIISTLQNPKKRIIDWQAAISSIVSAA